MAMSTSLGDCPVRNFDLGSHGGDTPLTFPYSSLEALLAVLLVGT
jgi:hypothetical protein